MSEAGGQVEVSEGCVCVRTPHTRPIYLASLSDSSGCVCVRVLHTLDQWARPPQHTTREWSVCLCKAATHPGSGGPEPLQHRALGQNHHPGITPASLHYLSHPPCLTAQSPGDQTKQLLFIPIRRC